MKMCLPSSRPLPSRHGSCLLLPMLLLLAALLALGGCSDATSPEKAAGNQLDPGNGTFALKDITLPGPGGEAVVLRLEGSDLQSAPEAGTVSLSVRVRNLSGRAVRPPLIVWLSGLQPEGVVPVNADLALPPPDTDPAVAADDSARFGFDYTELLGGEPLAAGEASPARTWTFADPSLGAFEFAAYVECGAFAGQAALGGRVFLDRNHDGVAQPEEPGYHAASVVVTAPDGVIGWFSLAEDGHWEMPVFQAGLYEAAIVPLDMSMRPLVLTTVSPLNVVITEGPDGALQSWLQADFGVAPIDVPPPFEGEIQFTDRPPNQLQRAPWFLLDAQAAGADLRLNVGFSGCQPDHAFSLWMSGAFQESMPPRAQVSLVHESEEACDAAFDASLVFDLLPLWDRYLEAYGPGPLIMVLHGADGFVREIPLYVAPPDSVWPVGARAAD